MRRVVFALALSSAVSCKSAPPPEPEWLVTIATDAPVPEFGDRLEIDVLDGAGKPVCSACERELGAADPSRWPISFGVQGGRTDVRLRARLFRTALIGADGSPTPPALIDRIVTLPPTEGIADVALTLPMSCFGVPVDIAGHRSCDPSTGALAPESVAPTTPKNLPAVGSWGPATPVGRPAGAPPGMSFVPGGAFLLGDPIAEAVVVVPPPDAPDIDPADVSPRPEHLVQVSPFWLDQAELTVATYNELKAQDPMLPDPLPQGSPAIADGASCTFGGSDASLPLTCVTQAAARAICVAQHKRLPREAEWEWAAGNLKLESPYPWGTDTNVCAHALVGRAGVPGPEVCLVTGTFATGPAPGGSAGDATQSGLLNLAGNVSEWVEDDFRPYTDPCWGSANLAVNPVCQSTSALGGSVRGGSYWSVTAGAIITTRNYQTATKPSAVVGFRCAMDI